MCWPSGYGDRLSGEADRCYGLQFDPNKTVPSTVIISDKTGKVIETIANEDGSDEVWYNDGDGSYFLARSGGLTRPQTLAQQLGIIDVKMPIPSVTGPERFYRACPTFRRRAHMDRLIRLPPTRSSTKSTFRIPSTSGGVVCGNAGGSTAGLHRRVYRAA